MDMECFKGDRERHVEAGLVAFYYFFCHNNFSTPSSDGICKGERIPFIPLRSFNQNSNRFQQKRPLYCIHSILVVTYTGAYVGFQSWGSVLTEKASMVSIVYTVTSIYSGLHRFLVGRRGLKFIFLSTWNFDNYTFNQNSKRF